MKLTLRESTFSKCRRNLNMSVGDQVIQSLVVNTVIEVGVISVAGWKAFGMTNKLCAGIASVKAMCTPEKKIDDTQVLPAAE